MTEEADYKGVLVVSIDFPAHSLDDAKDFTRRVKSTIESLDIEGAAPIVEKVKLNVDVFTLPGYEIDI